MDVVLLTIILVAVGYLLGSIPSAYLVGLRHGVDIRTQGSGNVGGANAGRLFGKQAFAFVGLFDMFKGTAAVLIASYFTRGELAVTGFLAIPANIIGLAGFAAVFGHCYPIWLRFKGGKGGATTAGVVLAISPLSFLVLLIFWVIIVGTTRFTSLGNLLAVLVIPVMLVYRTGEGEYLNLGIAIILLIYWRHRENIGRLLSGEERKFGNREDVQ